MRKAKTKARIRPYGAVIERLAHSIKRPRPDVPIPAESIKAQLWSFGRPMCGANGGRPGWRSALRTGPAPTQISVNTKDFVTCQHQLKSSRRRLRRRLE
jgi:hypothetical protein